MTDIKPITFLADRVQVSHNLSGETTKIVFSTGSYELENVAKLLLIPNEVNLEVSVKVKED